MMLFSAYKVLVSKLAGQEDLIVGIPVAGRVKSWMEPVFGMFVNTLPLRSQPKKELSFAGYLQQVRTRVLGAYENGDYPLEEIVRSLQLERDRSRNPLFDTAFVLQNMEEAAVRIPGMDVKSVPLPWKQSMFDMTWEAKEEAGTIRFHVEYCTVFLNGKRFNDISDPFYTFWNKSPWIRICAWLTWNCSRRKTAVSLSSNLIGRMRHIRNKDHSTAVRGASAENAGSDSGKNGRSSADLSRVECPSQPDGPLVAETRGHQGKCRRFDGEPFPLDDCQSVGNCKGGRNLLAD